MLYLVTGGSGSGKSAYAETLAESLYRTLPGRGALVYAATMYPYDDTETRDRIKRHRKERHGKGFQTTECYTNIGGIHAEKGDVVLLECMSNLLANEMYLEAGGLKSDGLKSDGQSIALPACELAEQVIVLPICRLAEQAGHVVVVTNEIFSDGAAQYDSFTRCYVNLLGYVNRRLENESAYAVEVVCGIPVDISRKNKGSN